MGELSANLHLINSTEIIDQVDPSLVLLDIFFRPGLDAARDRKRLHAFVVPNIPVDVFPLHQPFGKWLWKYPVYVPVYSIQSDSEFPCHVLLLLVD